LRTTIRLAGMNTKKNSCWCENFQCDELSNVLNPTFFLNWYIDSLQFFAGRQNTEPAEQKPHVVCECHMDLVRFWELDLIVLRGPQSRD